MAEFVHKTILGYGELPGTEYYVLGKLLSVVTTQKETPITFQYRDSDTVLCASRALPRMIRAKTIHFMRNKQCRPWCCEDGALHGK